MTPVPILLAEDEFLIRLVVGEALRHQGYNVIEAHEGTHAIALIDDLDGIDLPLTDVQMPGPVDGVQVAIHARQRHPDIPLVIVSAQPKNASRLAGLAPRKVFVAKPYDFATLVDTAQRMLDPDTPTPPEFAQGPSPSDARAR